MQRLRTGDEVIVLSGVDKGSRGQIERVLYDSKRQLTHVVITGVNKRWRHSKGNPHKNDPGGRIRQDAPLAVCKVALYNPAKEGPDRVRIKVTEASDAAGKKVKKRERVFASNNKAV